MHSSASTKQPRAVPQPPATGRHVVPFCRRARLVPAVLLVLHLVGCDRCRPPGESAVTLMSYNVQNLFDLTFDGTEHAEYRPEVNWDHETQARKLANIASVIAAARPDIVALQEVENAVAARQLRRALRLRGCRYPALAVADEPNRTVTCTAVLSRFPVVSSIGHAVPLPDGSHSRNLLEAAVALGADTLTLFVCHWPSKRRPESWRVAAARALAGRLAALPPAAEYVIVGDLNAAYDECETSAAAGHDDTRGVTGINHVLGTVESAPGAFVDYVTVAELAAGKSGCRHADLWMELDGQRRWNYRFRGRPDTPDHVIIPRSLLDGEGVSYVNGSFRVFRWHGRLLWNGAPYRWRIRRTREGPRHEGRGYSDHLPLLVGLRRGPYAAPLPPAPRPDAAPAPGTVGFESSTEGWIAWSSRARLTRDTAVAHSGRHSLCIEAAAERNQSAARTVLVPGRYGLGAGRGVSLALRGTGACVLRTRRGGNPWRYWCWNGNTFAKRSRPRYTVVNIEQWRKIVLDVGGTPADPVELELRTGKNEPLRVWVDEVRIEDEEGAEVQGSGGVGSRNVE